jgi:hypothetical protein
MLRNSQEMGPVFEIRSADRCQRAIADIFADQMSRANSSAYDVKVCVLAVAMARDEFNKLPVTGSARNYWAETMALLEAFRDNYDDRDGEYTNGAGIIGSVIERIGALKNRFQA